jgi:hypothetical protein
MERSFLPVEKIKLIFNFSDKSWFKGKENILLIALLLTVALIVFGIYELHTSRFEAYFLNREAKDLTFWTEKGPSPSIRFPKDGPYDKTVGIYRSPRLYRTTDFERLQDRDPGAFFAKAPGGQ